MLMRFQGFDGPLAMEIIRQRNINGFHLRIGQQLVITAVSLLKSEGFLIAIRFFQLSPGNGMQRTVLRLLHPRDRLPSGDVRRAKNTPFYFPHVRVLLIL